MNIETLRQYIPNGVFFGNWSNIKIESLINSSLIYNYKGMFLAYKNNKYVEESQRNGNICAMVECTKEINEHIMPFVFVENINNSLLKLCKSKLSKNNPIIIAVTGSVGKTTLVKNLAIFFRDKYKCFTNFKNYNTYLGLLYTISSMPEDTQILFLEIGISKPGEMTKIIDFLRPNISICTNILSAHSINYIDYDELVMEKIKVFHNSHTDYLIIPESYIDYAFKNNINQNNIIPVITQKECSLKSSHDNFLYDSIRIISDYIKKKLF